MQNGLVQLGEYGRTRSAAPGSANELEAKSDELEGMSGIAEYASVFAVGTPIGLHRLPEIVWLEIALPPVKVGMPPQLVPDPWTEGGTLARLGDADMDARVDVLALYQMKRAGLFSTRKPTCYMLDLDQDSFAGAEELPAVREVIKDRAFDAEMVFLEAAGQLYAWFDRDNDGKHDALLVAQASRRPP